MLFLRGQVLERQKRFAESAETFGYVSSLQTSPLCDRALLQKAKIESLNLRKKSAATKTLRELLTRFPSSIYSTEARKLLRNLEAETQSSS